MTEKEKDMTHPLAHTPTTATECLREALDGIDDCAAVIAEARGKCARQLYDERTAHLGEALDIINDVQGGLERLRGVVADGLYTARTTPPPTPNPVGLGMAASAKASFGATADGGDS